MSRRINDHGQPIGPALPDWAGAAAIPRTAMRGVTCDVVPLDQSQADDLFAAYSTDDAAALWTYMWTGPFQSKADFMTWMETAIQSHDPLYFAVIDKATGKAAGVAGFLRIDPANGVVEVGSIAFSPALQRTRAATEAMYLMMHRVFAELGYRRYEWKCDALNAPSRRAAERLGFIFEGIFRQAVVYKGRNRDTAWFSIVDQDWPRIFAALRDWLEPENFDPSGHQRKPLSAFMQR